MPNDKLESNKDTSLFPANDGDREDSGLQDILAVAAKIKDKGESDGGDEGHEPGDSGVIVFTAGELDLDAGKKRDEDEVLFGNFGGGLGLTAADSLTSPDLTPLAGEGAVKETRPVEQTAKPAPEGGRSPLTAVAVVLGLALVGTGIVFFGKPSPTPDQQSDQAAMSAKQDDEAAVGKAEPVDPAAADGQGQGAGEQEAGEQEAGAAELGIAETEGAPAETEGAPVEGEDGLLAAADPNADDPMAQKANLLGSGDSKSAPAGKWDQGQSNTSGGGGQVDDPDPDPDPDPSPVIDDPDPLPEPKPKSGGEASNDEVDCLLNPDLAKCQGGGGSKKKPDDEVLAPKIPDKLDSTQLRNGFNTVKSKAKTCGSKNGAEAGTKVKVHVSIEGATGKVTSAEALGEHAGTPLGKCVEEAVEGATFEVFKKPAMGIDYSMIM